MFRGVLKGKVLILNSKVIRMRVMHGWTVTEISKNYVVEHGQVFDVSVLPPCVNDGLGTG